MNSLDYWNNHAVNKTFTTTFAIERFRALVPVNARVLDVGCGYGRVLAELWSAGYRNLLGLDPAEALIRRGRGLFPHLPLTVQGNPPALDVADRSVDAALLCAVLTCVVDDAGQQRLLDEIRRVLRPGGVVYCSDFLLNDDERNRERYRRFADKYPAYGVFELPEGAILRHHTEDHVRRLFTAFQLDCFEMTTFPTMNGHASRGFWLTARTPA